MPISMRRLRSSSRSLNFCRQACNSGESSKWGFRIARHCCGVSDAGPAPTVAVARKGVEPPPQSSRDGHGLALGRWQRLDGLRRARDRCVHGTLNSIKCCRVLLGCERIRSGGVEKEPHQHRLTATQLIDCRQCSYRIDTASARAAVLELGDC